MEPRRIRDLVDVRAHPTVVRLDHLDGGESEWITESYCITTDVDKYLSSLRAAIAKPSGCGIFLIGSYGAGKSHFLAYVAKQARVGLIGDGSLKVVAVSLLNYAADARLEDIVCGALGLRPGQEDRRLSWSALTSGPRVILLLDEVSEFLRSKPTPQLFNEDVRFLQYIGEWAQGHRFWVIAAMQEQIEHAGDLEHALYRKIKDRYPLRFLLSPAHVRDLVSKAILIKQPGYAEAVEQLCSRLKKAYPDSNLDLPAMASIYPVHPVTLDLLEEVRDRFSQARGVVDFITTQLAGQATRGIQPFLDGPWGSFLSPDRIVDHFMDLFEIQPEFLPLAQRVLPHYRKNMDAMFETEPARELAWRVLKLLIVTYLSPVRKGVSPTEAAHWLLFTTARVDPAKNIRIIDRTMKNMHAESDFVQEKNGRYSLHLEGDGGGALEKMLARELAELQGRGDAVFELLAPTTAADVFNPFQLPRNEWQMRSLRWHFHERTYWVYLGDGVPPPKEDCALCIRLPWGESEPAPGVYMLQPARLTLGEETLELAALLRLRERPMNPDLLQRLDRRIAERVALFRAQVRSAYLEATITAPTGKAESPLRIDTSSSLQLWLEHHAQWILRRTYPSFERFAPSHGPLPKEAYRRFMRFAAEHDIGVPDADEYVKLIREAYLVPMGLLQRKGQDYSLPARLDRNELVSLLMPLVEHHPAPAVVYTHLASPVYGLVPDQIHLLLIFLLLYGELDIVKEKKSYRELFETLPTPIQYGKIVPGRALTADQLRDLQHLCDALGVRVPKQWTVAAQRFAVQQLREVARAQSVRFQSALLKLQQYGVSEELSGKLHKMLAQLAAIEKGEHELQGFEHFLYEIGSPARFLSLHAELSPLPDRIDRLLAELTRCKHLFTHPAWARTERAERVARAGQIGSPPLIDDLDSAERWLLDAKGAYDAYKADYTAAHGAFWDRPREIMSWTPPRVAASKHAGLEAELRDWNDRRERAARMVCHGLVNLDFQPVCTCGFDGESAPLEEELQRLQTGREKIETSLRMLFQDESIKSRMREWQAQGFELTTGTLAYLDGSAAVPDIENLALFDQHMSGLQLTAQIDIDTLFEELRGRSWSRQDLVAEIDRLLARYEPSRLRVQPRERDSGIVLWCVEQSLRHGVPLPGGLNALEIGELRKSIRPEWVSAETLERLESLALGEAAEESIVQWLIDGTLGLPAGRRVPGLVQAAIEVASPTRPGTAAELATLAETLYGQHHRMMRIAEPRWLDCLDNLANSVLAEAPDSLPALLNDRQQTQWLILDCLGLPLLSALHAELPALLPSWRVEAESTAIVSTETTTAAFFRDLVGAGHNHPLTKIDVVDRLLHERFLRFEDLRRVAAAELRIACRSLTRSLDPSAPITLFADHGFRIARDGRSYTHGGASMIERLVPVISLVPLT
ncbi:MAG: hypothetical protein HYX75_15580 [Acidobacteria bacterium]|nr:hypothetical protein [Acidobacteriota bacterium]